MGKSASRWCHQGGVEPWAGGCVEVRKRGRPSGGPSRDTKRVKEVGGSAKAEARIDARLLSFAAMAAPQPASQQCQTLKTIECRLSLATPARH